MLGLLGTDLMEAPECKGVLTHDLFARIARDRVDRVGAQRFLGQFWHPSHYFPTFLAQLIADSPTLEGKTSLSRILWQELGTGDPALAHESIYVTTALVLGLDDPSDPEAEPAPATADLVELYRAAAGDYLRGLGSLFATEAIDLTVVRALGDAVTAATGEERIPWVDIHAEQEPDHMESATSAVTFDLSAEETVVVRRAACEMWVAWGDFYTSLEVDLYPAALPVA